MAENTEPLGLASTEQLGHLRELATEGAALHSPGQPEHTICTGLLAALDELDRLRDVLVRLQQWADAYPVEFFPEPLRQDWQRANEVLAQAGLSMTRMSASNMRHVLNGARKMLAEGLGPNVRAEPDPTAPPN